MQESGSVSYNVVAETFFFSAKLVSSNAKTVALTRTPENVGETHDISFEAPFTPGM